MIKAIFFDIDGTLVQFGKHVMNERTIYALQQLQENGIKVCISTGRVPASIDLDYPFDGYITLNGQKCFLNNEVIYDQYIPYEEIETIYNYLEEHDCSAIFVSKHTCVNRYTQKYHDINKKLDFKTDPLGTKEEILSNKTYQIIAFITKEQEDELIQFTPHVKGARWHPAFCDMITKGNSKSKGIEKMINELHISKEETMAFGDGGNDKEMLEYVEVGVAMGNSKDDVKAVSDYVCESVEEDGVYHALIHFGLIKEKI